MLDIRSSPTRRRRRFRRCVPPSAWQSSCDGLIEVEPRAFSGLPFTNHHNARSTHLSFHIPRAGICHGFAGYFEAVLYGDVTLSIHPERAAGDMLSWFPIFFPLSVSCQTIYFLASRSDVTSLFTGTDVPPGSIRTRRPDVAIDGRHQATSLVRVVVRGVLACPITVVRPDAPRVSNIGHVLGRPETWRVLADAFDPRGPSRCVPECAESDARVEPRWPDAWHRRGGGRNDVDRGDPPSSRRRGRRKSSSHPDQHVEATQRCRKILLDRPLDLHRVSRFLDRLAVSLSRCRVRIV